MASGDQLQLEILDHSEDDIAFAISVQSQWEVVTGLVQNTKERVTPETDQWTVTENGVYLLMWNVSGTAANDGDIFEFAFFRDAALIVKLRRARKFSNVDAGNFGVTLPIRLSAGETVSLKGRNISSTGDFTLTDVGWGIVRIS